MTWSRKDIIADIKRREFDVDVTLPYWELRRRYRGARHIRCGLASGFWTRDLRPPPDAEEKVLGAITA